MTTPLTLKKRILLGYLIPLGLFVLASIATYFQSRVLQTTTNDVRDAQQITILAGELQAKFAESQSALRGFILTTDDRLRVEMSEADQQYAASRKALDILVQDSEQSAQLKRIDTSYMSLREHNDVLLALVAGRKAGGTIDVKGTTRATELALQLEKSLDLFVKEERKLLEQRVTHQTQLLGQMVVLVAGATVVAILLSMASGVFIASRISRSVAEMIGSMSASTAEIASMVDEHERTATQQAAAVNETTSTVEELSASSRQSADQAESTAAVAQQALEAATEGSRLATRVAQDMADMQHKVGSVAEQISRLSEQAGQIGGIARVVGELASETNMLALNAAVEAARAGEQGKGFAVVASEVRKLAEQSKKSAERVHTVVTEIQKATNAAVMVAEDGTRTAVDVAAITQRTLQAFEEISNAAQSVSVSTQQVVLNSKQQAIGLNQVTEAMKSLTAGAVQIATATQQTKQGVKNLDQVARDLSAVI